MGLLGRGAGRLRDLLLWLSSKLPAEEGAAPPRQEAAAEPAPVAGGFVGVERRCAALAGEIEGICLSMQRPPDRVSDDLVAPSLCLIWDAVRPSDLAWLDEPRLARLEEKSHRTAVGLEEPGARGEPVWSSQDFDSAASAVAELRGKILPSHPTLCLVLEIVDRSALGAWLRGDASAPIRIVPIVAPDVLLANLRSLSLLDPEAWAQLGVDFSRFTVLVGMHGAAPRVDAGLIQVCPAAEVPAALAAAASAAEGLEAARRVERCRRESGDLPLPARVTPLHFKLRQRSSQDAAEQQCARIATDLALAYLADRVVPGPPTRMTFRGFRPMAVDLTAPPAPSSLEEVAALCDLVDWSCDDRYSDKLEVVHRLISLRLTDDAEKNYPEILSSAPRLLAAAKENWQVYLGQATQVYFEKQKELGDYIAAKVAQYSERLDSLVKGLSGYGITLLGFFFTDYFVKQQDPAIALASRHAIASAFFYYSLAILAVLFGHAALEEVLLGKELEGERERLRKFFGDQELVESVDRTVGRRRAQFRILLALAVVLAAAALYLFFRHIQQAYGGLKW